jgi:SAM-dependent methyltransferase
MANFDRALRRYYDERARVYDDIYLRRDPTWRRNLEALADEMTRALSGRNVLEVACGTGFWTEIAAKTVAHIVAVDSSEKMLTIARQRTYSGNVEYIRGNAYSLKEIPGKFDAGLANFWFSHVPKSKINEFLSNFHNKLERPALVFMADNRYVPGIGGQLITKAGIEDTFKLREAAADRSKHEVLKNYYDRENLERLFSPKTLDLKIQEIGYFWCVKYLLA